MSKDSIETLDKFATEIMGDEQLRKDFERLETLVDGFKGPVHGAPKVQRLMACVEGHIKRRSPPDNNVSKRREFYKFVLRSLYDGIKYHNLEGEMSQDTVGGKASRGIIAFFSVCCWRLTTAAYIATKYGGDDKDALTAPCVSLDLELVSDCRAQCSLNAKTQNLV